MAGITTALCNSYKKELIDGVHLAADVYMIALIKPGMAGTFDKTTVNYSALGADEVANGGGYTTLGQALAGYLSALTGDVANLTWTDPVWAAATIAARGMMIYNSSRGNKAVMVVDFGATITSTAAAFTVDLPATGAAALIRVG